MKALFLDCISGISGDMMVGALIDLGVKPSALEWELSKLNLGDFHMHYDRAKRKDIEGVKFDIHGGATHGEHCCDHDHNHGHDHDQDHGHAHEEKHEHGPEHHHHPHAHEKHEHEEHGHAHEHGEHCDHGPEGHKHSHEHEKHGHAHEHGEHCDHDHEPSHEHEAGHGHSHEHDEHEHDHDHGHEHGHHHHHEHGRTHQEIQAMLSGSELSPFVKKHALGIFRRIAEAEGKIHGMSAEEVHFHEVGAFDSIADIVLTCVGLETLGVEKVICSRLHDGHGTVQCAHGTFPVPAPATLEILKGIPIGQIDVPHELITPTGAAIVAEFAEKFDLMPAMQVEKIGYGLGTRELATRPNVLRAVLGQLAS
jgi:pyridinium-3,5-bisthiocarboxylic acid mononucleotide nickel chelatase